MDRTAREDPRRAKHGYCFRIRGARPRHREVGGVCRNLSRSKADLPGRLCEFPREWGKLPAEEGLSLTEMMEAAKAGKLKALYVVGSNPVGRLGIDPFAL